MSRLVVAGPVVSRFREPDGDEHDIRLTVPHGERQDLSGFDALQVPAMTGSYVPIRQLADLRQARIEFSGEELADLVTRVATSGLGGGDWKPAIVVADPVQYGVSRQCQVFAEHFSRDAILHDVESALAWLVGEE